MSIKEILSWSELKNSLVLIIAICFSYAFTLLSDCEPIGVWGIVLAIITLLMPTVYYIKTFKDGEQLGEKFTFYFLNLLIMIGYFAVLYKSFGIQMPHGQEADLFDALYFSVVTWTTLGYGDILPSSFYTKVFVIVEVILGYIYMGILIGKILVLSRLGETKAKC